jgi:hypothetical protein
MLKTLASMGLQQDEIAAALECSPKTIQRRHHDVWVEGHTMCKASLRRKMFEVGMKGHAGMLMFLAKNYMGMRDDPEAPKGTDQRPPMSVVYIQAVNKALGFTGELIPIGNGQRVLEAGGGSENLPE